MLLRATPLFMDGGPVAFLKEREKFVRTAIGDRENLTPIRLTAPDATRSLAVASTIPGGRIDAIPRLEPRDTIFKAIFFSHREGGTHHRKPMPIGEIK
jgi:hypothetical protein